jgi:CheY-specific phosphatase CheX
VKEIARQIPKLKSAYKQKYKLNVRIEVFGDTRATILEKTTLNTALPFDKGDLYEM